MRVVCFRMDRQNELLYYVRRSHKSTGTVVAAIVFGRSAKRAAVVTFTHDHKNPTEFADYVAILNRVRQMVKEETCESMRNKYADVVKFRSEV